MYIRPRVEPVYSSVTNVSNIRSAAQDCLDAMIAISIFVNIVLSLGSRDTNCFISMILNKYLIQFTMTMIFSNATVVDKTSSVTLDFFGAQNVLSISVGRVP